MLGKNQKQKSGGKIGCYKKPICFGSMISPRWLNSRDIPKMNNFYGPARYLS